MLNDNYYRKAIVTYVVDGDTFDARVDLGFHVFVEQRFRMKGINAPELKGETKVKAEQARAYLASLILGQEILIQSVKLDGFRRYLADVYMVTKDEQKNISQLMLDGGYAVPFMVN